METKQTTSQDIVAVLTQVPAARQSVRGDERQKRCEEREKPNKMQQLDVYQLQSQNFLGIIMPSS